MTKDQKMIKAQEAQAQGLIELEGLFGDGNNEENLE